MTEELERWRASAGRPQTQTNRASTPVLVARVSPTGSSHGGAPQGLAPNRNDAAGAPAASRRTHKVEAGETLSRIARAYGIRLETLMQANPNLNPRRMQVGQTLTVPAQ